MKMRNYILLLAAFSFIKVNAQDIHFAQFTETSTYINPAKTGLVNGHARANLNYRGQWGILGSSYKTYSFAYDMPILRNGRNAYLGAGLMAFRDKAGDGNLGETNLAGLISGLLKISPSNTISVGFKGGYVWESVSAGNLTWDNQFNGTNYDAGLTSGEGFNSNFGYFDYSTGINWQYKSKSGTITSNDQFEMNIGGAYSHFTRPSLQFKGGDKLYSKITVHADAAIGLKGTNISLIPALIFYKQSNQIEILMGGIFKYALKRDAHFTGFKRGSSIGFGAMYRYRDAIIPTITFEYADFAVGVSYDLNVSTLSPYTKGLGGIEVSLRYVDVLGNLFGNTPSHGRY